MYGNPYNPYLTNQMNGMFPQNNPGFTPPTPQNFQNPVPNMQPPSIRGRLVQSVEEIRPNEVPMDGSVSYFPQSDLSCIYAKQWQPNGTIATQRYVLDIPKQPDAQPEQNSMNEILEKLSNIQQRLDALGA